MSGITAIEGTGAFGECDPISDPQIPPNADDPGNKLDGDGKPKQSKSPKQKSGDPVPDNGLGAIKPGDGVPGLGAV